MDLENEKYSRLTALSKLGVVPNFADIRNMTVILIGVGGVGSVAAEMLVRCAIGKLVMFDYDTVETANMNRMFFMPDQVGSTKIDAAISTLSRISEGAVDLSGFNGNITSIEYYGKLKAEIIHAQNFSSRDNTLVLCCVDNYAARVSVNRACLETDQTWVESGVSETALSGHIQVMIPGVSGCFECAPPTVMAEQGDERNILRNGVCAASLPTTMSIIGGLLVQTALKVLLKFGEVNGCVGYNALTDFFPSYRIKPNTDCISDLCRMRQETSQLKVEKHQEEEDLPVIQPDVCRIANQWNIEVVSPPLESEEARCSDSNYGGSSINELVERLRRR